MKIGIIGYGRMGKMIEQIAILRGHEIVAKIDIGLPDKISEIADCYIDFSVAAAIESNIKSVCSFGKSLIIGITGWQDHFEKYHQIFLENGVTGIWGGNFSLGVNLFYKALNETSKIFDAFNNEYDTAIHEFHHKNKVDSPSGTALQMANIVLHNSTKKDSIVIDALQRKRNENELHVSSTRVGSVPGTHTVLFDSVFDTIELTHTARTREGFALGAVLAAENIHKLENGLHNFYEVFDTIIERKIN